MQVIDLGGEAIKATEYTHLGRVTEFKYSSEIGRTFRRYSALKYLRNFGEGWAMLPRDKALVFVDNHDNQRGHGAGGANVLTFWEPRMYKMATAFMLSWPYGFVRIMSSYRWPGGRCVFVLALFMKTVSQNNSERTLPLHYIDIADGW